MCAEWQSYLVFRDWALANGYEPGLSIEREKADKNYEPSNCSWVTKSQNSKLMRAKYHFVARSETVGELNGLLGFGT